MDKKNFKNLIKIYFKIYFRVFVLIFPLAIVFFIIKGIINGFDDFRIFDIVMSLVYMFVPLFLIFLIIIIILFFVYKFLDVRRKKDSVITNNYTREIPKNVPPAIVSFLLDLSVEVTTDYTATIAYLISNKYIKMDNNKIVLLNDNIVDLSRHEQYVLECVIEGKSLSNDRFIKLVMDDAMVTGLIKKEQRKINVFKNLILFILVFIFCSILKEFIINSILELLLTIIGVFAGVSIFAFIAYSIYLSYKYRNESFIRTNYGKKASLEWAGLKKYFHDFNLLADKKLGDIILYDDYIPYAIALNEAKSIEKYIENNSQYRKLIYGKIEDFYI